MVSLTKNDGILKSTEWSSTIYSIKLANWQNETTESSIRFPAFIEQFSCKLNHAYAHPRGHSWSFSLVIHDHWLETFESVLFACFYFRDRPTEWQVDQYPSHKIVSPEVQGPNPVLIRVWDEKNRTLGYGIQWSYQMMRIQMGQVLTQRYCI